MASTNEEVAALLREYADLLAAERALTTVPGVGPSVAVKIAEYQRTGTIKAVDDLRAEVPPGALVLAKVPGVGPRRALQVVGELGITTWPSWRRRSGTADCAG